MEGPWGEIVELYLERWVGTSGACGDEIVHPGSLGVLERREGSASPGWVEKGGGLHVDSGLQVVACRG